MQKQKINNRIRVPEVRVINQDGQNIGVMATTQAIKLAEESGLDLVEVSSQAKPPVCKILDHSKYLYEQKAKLKKSKPKKTDLKELQLRPNIGEGDLKMRIERGKEFLAGGNMVKYTVKFKGREKKYPEIGRTKLKIVESELAAVSQVERENAYAGGTISIVLMPKK